MRCPVLLERAEVVGVPEFVAQLLEDGPVPLLRIVPDRLVQVAPQVGDDSVVVEQGVVDIEQEDNRVFHAAQITSHELAALSAERSTRVRARHVAVVTTRPRENRL